MNDKQRDLLLTFHHLEPAKQDMLLRLAEMLETATDRQAAVLEAKAKIMLNPKIQAASSIAQ